MRRGLVWLLGLTPTLALAGADAPMHWSPDGRWVAYTVSTPADRPILPPGWLFRNDRGASTASREGVAGGPGMFRLYATEADAKTSVLLEESPWPLTSPEWSPDGRALTFGRLRGDRPGPLRFEVVIQEGPRQQRVLLSRALGERQPELDGLPSRVLAWSPDSRYLVVPNRLSGFGLSIVRADNGQTIKSLEGVSWPVWSPDGTKLALIRMAVPASLELMDAFGLDEALFLEMGLIAVPASLELMDTGFGPPKRLADLGQTYQAPVWSRDSKSVMVVASRGRPPTRQVELLRVQVDSGSVETIAQLASISMQKEKSLLGVSFSIDRDGVELFSTVDLENQPSAIAWFHPRTMETLNRFNPLDVSLRAGSLALAPGNKTLAMRLGPGPSRATAAFWDVATGRLSPLVSDDSARLEWLTMLINSARRLLLAGVPQPALKGQSVDRPTILPVPGEIPPNQDVVFRLRRIARFGRPLCDRPTGAAEADPSVEGFLSEARLFFDVLREDYPAALHSLEALEARSDSPDHHLRLLSLRAQIFLGMGDVDRAKDTIEYLRSLDQAVTRRFETTPAGMSFTAESVATNGWGGYLANRLDDLARAKATNAGNDDAPLGHLNPDAPLPAPGMVLPNDRDPNAVFVPQRRGGFPPGDVAPDIRVRFRPRRPFPGMPPPPPPQVIPRPPMPPR
jgi:hypothetical protein